MKHISLLVPRGSFMINTVEGPYTVFSAVNEFLLKNGKRPLFTIQLVGLMKQNQVNTFYTVSPDITINDLDNTDLIIIPAFLGDLNKAISNNKDYVPWIVRQHKNGAEVASLCLGAFLLASTGLLKGKQCATHWTAENMFRKMSGYRSC